MKILYLSIICVSHCCNNQNILYVTEHDSNFAESTKVELNYCVYYLKVGNTSYLMCLI